MRGCHIARFPVTISIMEMLKRAILIAFALSLLVPATSASAQPLTVSGAVHDELGRALGGAEVLLFATQPAFAAMFRSATGGEPPLPRLSTKTGADGHFLLAVPEPGMWRVEVRHPGRVAVAQALQPLLESQELAAAVLRPDVGTRVTVRDPKNRPIAQAQVELRSYSGRMELWGIGWRPAERQGKTSADGTVRLPAAASESVGLQARASGFLPAGRYSLERSIPEISLAAALRRPLVVLDEAGGPAAGVLVMADEGSAVVVTAADGRCEVEVSPQGTTRLRFLAADGRTARGEVPPPKRGERRPPSFKLEAPRVASGFVRDGESGEAAAGAVVWSEMDPASFVLAGGDGSFHLPLLVSLPENFLSAAKVGYFPAQARATEMDRTREPLLLEPKTAIYGRVVDETGAALAGAQATLAQQLSTRSRGFGMAGRDSGREASSTGTDGRFRLAAVANELYRLEVTLEGFVPWEKEVAAGNKALRVVMSRGRIVLGRVVGQEGQPLVGVKLSLIKSEETRGFMPSFRGRGTAPKALVVASDEEGRFRFERVGAGSYHVDGAAPGHAPYRQLAVRIPAGSGTVDLGSLKLETDVSVTGRVVDAAGAPVAGTSIKVEGRAWQPGEDGANSEEMAMIRRFQRRTMMGAGGQEAPADEVQTDAEGSFVVGGLSEGERVTVVAEREGYAPARVVAVEAPNAEPLTLVLQRKSSVAGVVVDESGRPVAGAMVSVQESDSSRSGSSQRFFISGMPGDDVRPTDESGRFERANLRPGRVQVSAEAPGFAPQNLWVEVPPGARVDGVRLELARGGIVEGRVSWADGAPVPMAFVMKMTPDMIFSTTSSDSETDEEGHYRLSGVAPGEWFFECHTSGGKRGARQRLLVQPGTNKLDFVLESGTGHAVTGRAIDSSGTGVAAARVMLQGGGRMSPPTDTTHADGSFQIEDVADGTYTVRVIREGFSMVEPELRLEMAGRAIDSLVVEMFSGGRIEGRVVGLEARRFPGVTIQAEGESMRFGFAVTGVDAEGGFALTNQAPGRYRLVAQDGVGGRSVDTSVVLAEGQEVVAAEIDFSAGLTLSGWVKIGDEPAAGARLVLSGLDFSSSVTGKTNHLGRFELAGLEAGRYRVEIYAENSGASKSEEIELSSDDEMTFEIEVGGLAGRVVERTRSRGVGGARLLLLPWEGTGPSEAFPSEESVTDSLGNFDLGTVAAGEYRLRAVKSGYITSDQKVEIRAGERQTVDLELEAGAELVLSLSSALGAPPDYVQVAALDAEGKRVLYDNLFTDQNAELHITRLPPGRFTLLVGSFNTAFVEVETVLPGPAVPVFLPMGSHFLVEVPALAAEPTLARVSLFDAAGKPFRSAARGDGQIDWPVSGGTARITGLRPGLWRVVVTAPDGRTWETSAEAPATGGTVPVRVE